MSASKRFFVSFFRRINNIWKITFMVNMSTQLNYKTKHVSKEIYLTKLYLHYSVSKIFFCFLFYLCPWISLSLCLLYLFLLVSPLSLCLPVSLSHLLCLFVSLSLFLPVYQFLFLSSIIFVYFKIATLSKKLCYLLNVSNMQWKLLNVIIDNIINWVMWSELLIMITLSGFHCINYLSRRFACCDHLNNVICFSLSQIIKNQCTFTFTMWKRVSILLW
jgi:hypothetical protein